MSNIFNILINKYKQKQQAQAKDSPNKTPEDHLNFIEKLEIKKEQEAVEPTSERYQALKRAEEQGNAQEKIRQQQEELRKQEVKAQFNELIEQPVMKGLAEHKYSAVVKLKPQLAKDLRTYYQQEPSKEYYIHAYTGTYIDLSVLSPDYTPFIKGLAFYRIDDVLTILLKLHKSVDN